MIESGNHVVLEVGQIDIRRIVQLANVLLVVRVEAALGSEELVGLALAAQCVHWSDGGLLAVSLSPDGGPEGSCGFYSAKTKMRQIQERN